MKKKIFKAIQRIGVESYRSAKNIEDIDTALDIFFFIGDKKNVINVLSEHSAEYYPLALKRGWSPWTLEELREIELSGL
tara:strand:+ start:101 stop:337 length:237 start_codon:yes stop_codon:yes gene_type:complete